MSVFDQKDNDVPIGSNIRFDPSNRFDPSKLKVRSLLVLYVIAGPVAMAAWLWILGSTGMRFVEWLLN